MTRSATSPELPPPLVRERAGRLARIARMERAALRELLADTGALIDAALRAREVPPADHDGRVVEVAVALWADAALLSAPAPAERDFVLARALAAVPAPELVDTELDAALLTRLGARVLCGLASDADRGLLEGARADARVARALESLTAACEGARAAPAGGGRALALWSAIEPRLR